MNCSGSLTVKEIAEWTGKDDVFIRKSIENGSLGIGAYVRNGNRASYYISPKLAYERLGYKRHEEGDDNHDPGVAAWINECESSRKMLGNGILQVRHNGIGDTDNRISNSSR